MLNTFYVIQNVSNIKLVGGLELFFVFHILRIIIPIDKYFSVGLKPQASKALKSIFVDASKEQRVVFNLKVEAQLLFSFLVDRPQIRTQEILMNQPTSEVMSPAAWRI